jgi:hypothetical protein
MCTLPNGQELLAAAFEKKGCTDFHLRQGFIAALSFAALALSARLPLQNTSGRGIIDPAKVVLPSSIPSTTVQHVV